MSKDEQKWMLYWQGYVGPGESLYFDLGTERWLLTQEIKREVTEDGLFKLWVRPKPIQSAQTLTNR